MLCGSRRILNLSYYKRNCEELPLDQKMIIVCDFQESYTMVEVMLDKLELEYSSSHGKVKRGAIIKEIRRFKQDAGCRFLVAQHQTLSEGGNFQMAQHMFFYESPVPVIARRQMEKRIHRTGQKTRVRFYDPIMMHRASVERKILDFHVEGRDLFKALIEGQEVFR